ncbi:MAG: hypothetical protein ACOYM7_04475 [Paludibacter sp.]
MSKEHVQSSEPFKMSGNWNNQSLLLKDKFAQLTDADLRFEDGKEEELLQRIEARIHKKREEVINIIRKGQ